MGKSTFEALFEFDDALAEKGARMHYGQNAKGEDIVFIVAKMGNPNHEKEFMRRQRQIQAHRHNSTAQNRIAAEIVGKTILLDWEGVLDKEGQPMEATLENRINVLTKYKELRAIISDFADDNFNYIDDGADLDAETDTEGN